LSWWAGEEVGLPGAEHYFAQLPAFELAKIRLYLNFDMIASPNYVYAIYDGDGSPFNVSGPQDLQRQRSSSRISFNTKKTSFSLPRNSMGALTMVYS
jgi:Zn-dependent M28 family amino/carboxypeptidase